MTHDVLRWIIRKKVDPKRHRKDVIESQRDREYMETLYGLNEAKKGKKVQKTDKCAGLAFETHPDGILIEFRVTNCRNYMAPEFIWDS